jgi:hypothetical protein
MKNKERADSDTIYWVMWSGLDVNVYDLDLPTESTLPEIVQICVRNKALSAELFDDAGFPKGYVARGGSWALI